MTEPFPDPPLPLDADLKDFPFTPIYRARLFGSSFHARATDAEWRAGVTLWLKSQDQLPAGSLPDDDIDLCRLAELGRDLKTWRKVRTGALHGWYRCNDGRLYHKVVAEVVAEQHLGKLRRKWSTECARARKHAQRHGVTVDVLDFETWLSQGQPSLVSVTPQIRPADTPDTSQGQTSNITETGPECHAENGSKGQRERKGQGQGQGQKEENNLSGFAPQNADVADEMTKIWNEECGSIARANKPNPTRRASCAKRFREDFGSDLEAWRAYCRRIAAAPHLRGENDRLWRADLDWVLEPRNLSHITEGRYDRRVSSGQNGHDADPSGEDLRHQLRVKSYREHGTWRPEWGEPPALTPPLQETAR